MSAIDKDNSIAICIISDNKSAYMTEYCINNLLAKSTMPVELFLYDLSHDENYLQHNLFSFWAPKHVYLNRFIYKGLDSPAKCRNHFLSIIQKHDHKHAAIVPINYLVNKHWDTALFSEYVSFTSAGVLGIYDETTDIRLSPALSSTDNDDYQLNLTWQNKNSFVCGLIFFSRENAEKIGMHEYGIKHGLSGFEDEEFCFKAAQCGLNCFYIVGHSAYCFPQYNEKIFGITNKEEVTKFINYINKINQDQNGTI